MNKIISTMPVPCINCLLLPMCRTYAIDLGKAEGPMTNYTKILKKCSILYDYVYCMELYRPERFCYALDIIEDKLESKQRKR